MAEEKFNNNKISTVIQNFLTLRYDPSQKSFLPTLTSSNFEPSVDQLSLEQIETLLQNYVLEKFSNPPKKITISLSGGIDSTLILAILRKALPSTEIHAISIRFANSVDETSWAKKIADKFEANFEILEIENYLYELPKSIQITELPFWDIHWYYVANKAKQYSNFLASGDGGDELFGGYVFRYSKFLSMIKPNSTITQKISAYLNCHERDWVPDQEKLFGQNSNFNWETIHKIFEKYFDNSLDPINQVFLADYNGKLLYNFSIISNKINHSFNIDAITPILSNELITYSSHLSPELKYDFTQNIGKLPLRKLLKKYGADSLISQKKLGFSVDTLNLWESVGRELCESYLENGRLIENKFIEKNWISGLIRKPDLNVRYVNKFLGLLSLELWYRLFVTKEIDSNLKLG